jgi:hypothetical protein
MSNKQHITGRVPQDTFQKVERYKTERDISRADAVRRIIERGLEVEQPGESSPTAMSDLVHFWATVLGAFLAGVSLVLLPAWAFTPYVPPLFVFTVALLTTVWNAGAYSYARRTGLTGVGS